MLPVKHRLTNKEDFALVYARGSYANHANIVIKYLKTTHVESRLGFPLGKNYSKKAIQRNRTRRLLRAAAFELLPQLKTGFDIVIMIKGKAEYFEYKRLQMDLAQAFRKAKLFICK